LIVLASVYNSYVYQLSLGDADVVILPLQLRMRPGGAGGRDHAHRGVASRVATVTTSHSLSASVQ